MPEHTVAHRGSAEVVQNAVPYITRAGSRIFFPTWLRLRLNADGTNSRDHRGARCHDAQKTTYSLAASSRRLPAQRFPKRWLPWWATDAGSASLDASAVRR